ncbi:hypothetical protein BUE80_DR011489 [Diplocarpon rosae]|nr:hypothetical protein BUE80_DR011489 [Diplocarpon rosae]
MQQQIANPQNQSAEMELLRSQTSVSSARRSQATVVESVPERPGRGVERCSEGEFVVAQGFGERVAQPPPPVTERTIEVQKDPAPKLKITGITLKRLFSIGLGEKREKAEATPVYRDPNELPRETATRAPARDLWEEQAKRYTDFASLFPGNQASAPTPGPAQQHACRPAQRSDMGPRSRTFPRHKKRNQTQTRSRLPVQEYTRKYLPVPEAEAETENEVQALARLRWEADERPYADMAARSHYLSREKMTPSRAQSLPQDHQVPESASTDIGIEESPEPPVQRRESKRRETGETHFLWGESEDLAAEYRFLIQQWLHPWEDDVYWI